jgi:hypothetical protein
VEEAPAARRHLHRHAARLSVRGSSRFRSPGKRQGKVRDLPHLQKTRRVSHIPRHHLKLGLPHRETERGVAALSSRACSGGSAVSRFD